MEGGRACYTVIVNRAQAIRFAIQNARPDDFILLAGKGHETYQVPVSYTHLDVYKRQP